MSLRGSCPHDLPTPSESAVGPERIVDRPAKGAPRLSRVRFLREHAVALSLIGLLVLVALPPALVSPSGALQAVSTGVLSLCACVLVAAICFESLGR